MSNIQLYNKKILYNNAYPIDKHFQTCLSLSRKTFEEIEEISAITKIGKRSNIIEKAVEHYVNELRSSQNSNNLQTPAEGEEK